MAEITFTYDTGDVEVSRIYDAIAEIAGYSEFIYTPEAPAQPIVNPQTKESFARDVWLKSLIVSTVRESDTRAAIAAARASVEDITLT